VTVLHDIFNKFLELEQNLQLFEKKFDGVHFWQHLRAPVIQHVYRMTTSEQALHDDSSTIQKVQGRLSYMLWRGLEFFRSPIFFKKSDIFFLCSPRRLQLEDGLWWDIYTDFIINDIELKVAVLEPSTAYAHRRPAKTSGVRDEDFLDFLRYIAEKLRLVKVNLSIEDRLLIQKIRHAILKHTNVDIDLETIITRRLGFRKVRYPFYRLMLKRIRPKVAVVITGYHNTDFVEAAKSLSIPVIELQHGAISQYHPGYSYPNGLGGKQIFPDWFFAFGDYWAELVDFPLDKDRVVSMGFPYLDEEMKKYSDVPRKKQIVFISQSPIGEKLSKFAETLSTIEHGYKLVYKLHPLECEGWQERYPWLVNADIDVISDSKTSLYKLFAESEIQVGVFSTAIYEGLAFGLATFLLDVPGVEYFNSLIESGVAAKVSSALEFAEFIKHRPDFTKFDQQQFFRQNAKNNILHWLRDFLAK